MRRWRRSLPTRGARGLASAHPRRDRLTSKNRPRPGNGKGAAVEDPSQGSLGGEGEACDTSAILAALLHPEPPAKPIGSRPESRDGPRAIGGSDAAGPSLRSLRSPDRLACAILGGACLGIGRDSSRSLG